MPYCDLSASDLHCNGATLALLHVCSNSLCISCFNVSLPFAICVTETEMYPATGPDMLGEAIRVKLSAIYT